VPTDQVSGDDHGREDLRPDSEAVTERAGRPRRRGAVLGSVVLGLVLLVVLLDAVTSSPALCTSSCHEMQARADSWQESAHTGVGCVMCHEPVRPWYALPLRLVDRAQLLARDIRKHSAGGYADPVEVRSPGTSPIKDEVCLQCHDPRRKATSGMRILIDHVEHARRNGSCVSCHIRTAHPIETRGAALSLMSQCFTCHGWAATAKAPARCGLCHPAEYRLRPSSHTTAAWKQAGHGVLAKADVASCEMCHEKPTCDGCHGIEMPHPMGWPTTGHGPAALKDRGVCDACHWGHPDMCTVCHHKGYDPAHGEWMEQHAAVAKRGGNGPCLQCHPTADCTRCHPL